MTSVHVATTTDGKFALVAGHFIGTVGHVMPMLAPHPVTVGTGCATHAPLVQRAPFGHTTPQPPQLFESLDRSVSQPSPGLTSQSANPAGQLVTAQAELLHATVSPLIAWQVLPQNPQLFESELVSTHAPEQPA
jgi:hypothetical protein